MKSNSDKSYDGLYSILLNEDNIQEQKNIQANNMSSFFVDKSMKEHKRETRNKQPARVREQKDKDKKGRKEIRLNKMEQDIRGQKESKKIDQIKDEIESQLQQRIKNQPWKDMMQKMIIEKLQAPQSAQKLQSNKYQFNELFVKPKQNELKKIQEQKDEHNQIEDEDVLMQRLRKSRKSKQSDQNEHLEIKVSIKIKKPKQILYIYNQLFYLEIPKKTEVDDFDQKNMFLENGFVCAIPLIDEEDLESLENKIFDMKLKLKGDKSNNEEYKKAHLNFILGFYFEKQNRMKKAVIQYKKFIKNCVILEDKEGIMIGSNRISVCLAMKNRYKEALKYNQIQISNSEDNLKSLYLGYFNKAVLLRLEQKVEQALEHMNYAMEFIENEQILKYKNHYQQYFYLQQGFIFY